MKIACVCVGLSLLLSGCLLSMAAGGPVAKVDAKRHLLPVVEAIETFKREVSRLPATLEELQARQKTPFKLISESESGVRWTISYELRAPSYLVSFDHAHYTLGYRDGKEDYWTYNPWR